MRADVRALVGQVKRNGWEVRELNSGHLQVRDPTDGRVMGSIPGTPSDWRALKNAKANLKRSGALTPRLIIRRIQLVTAPPAPPAPPAPAPATPPPDPYEMPAERETPQTPVGRKVPKVHKTKGTLWLSMAMTEALVRRLNDRVLKDGSIRRWLVEAAVEDMLDALDELDTGF